MSRGIISFQSDARKSALVGVRVTVGASGVVTSVAVPDAARGFRLCPTGDVRFAVDENPAAEAAASGETVALAGLAAGATARAGEWEARLLEDGAGRTLRLRGAAGGEVVLVEFF